MELQTKAEFGRSLTYTENAENGFAEASGACLRCKVSGNGEGVVIHCDPNTSLYFRNVRIPAIRYRIIKGHTVIDTEIMDEAATKRKETGHGKGCDF